MQRITFGKWHSQLDYLDDKYNNLATKLIRFVNEAGEDEYNRYFNLEPIVDFVLEKGFSKYSADYIYRHYVYYLISQKEYIDIDKEEDLHILSDFVLIPEKRVLNKKEIYNI